MGVIWGAVERAIRLCRRSFDHSSCRGLCYAGVSKNQVGLI